MIDKTIQVDLRLMPESLNKVLIASFDMGKVTAIYGKSGCGKTSLLNAIAGFNLSAGSVFFANRCWQDDKLVIKPHHRGIGYVMQDSLLFPHLSVIDNIAFGQHEGSVFKLDEVLDLLSITDFAERPVAVLSGGQQQRVALARALLGAKNFLLLDEPLSAVDVGSRDQILRILRSRLEEKKLGALYVSHSLDELAIIADNFCSFEENELAVKALPDALTDEDALISQGAAAESVIQVSFIDYDEQFGISSLRFAKGVFQVTGNKGFEYGEILRLRIHAKDVSLSLKQPESSSILNVFQVEVLHLKALANDRVMVYLGLGENRLLASISRKSAQFLELDAGEHVFAQIKAVAIC